MLTDDQNDVEDLKEHELQPVRTAASMGRGGRGGEEQAEIVAGGFIPRDVHRQRRRTGRVDLQAHGANMPRGVE